MFSKFAITLAMAISLMTTPEAFAQVKKSTAKAAVKASEAKKVADDAKKAAEDSQKTEEAKKAAEEALKIAEAKLVEAKAKEEKENTVWNKIRSIVSVSYHGEFTFARRDITSANEADHEIQDFKALHNPTVIIKPFNNWKITVTSEFNYSDIKPLPSGFPNRHYRSLVLLTRENVLTEALNGVKMDLSLGRRLFDRKAVPSTYGNSRIYASFSKKVNDKLSSTLITQYLFNDPSKSGISQTTWKHAYNLFPSLTFKITDKLSYFFNDDFNIYIPRYDNTKKKVSINHDMNVAVFNYQFNDKSSAYYQFKYFHTDNFETTADDYFLYAIGYAYAITPYLTITPEIGSKMFKASDKKSFFATNMKYPEFFLYVDASY